eukprot:gene7044-416_t
MATAGSSESYGAEAHYEAVHHGYRQAPLQTIENMLEQEIPKTLFELESSKKNLAQVADHIENAYNTVASTPNTREAFQQAQQYTIQALASVAYQVNAASSCLLQTLAVQDENIRLLGTELAGPRRKILMQEEQKGRAAISCQAEPMSRKRTKKCVMVDVKSDIKPMPEYFSYDILDDIGHGVYVKLSQDNKRVSTKPMEPKQSMTERRNSYNTIDTSQLYVNITAPTIPAPAAISMPTIGGDSQALYETLDNVSALRFAPTPPQMPVVPPVIVQSGESHQEITKEDSDHSNPPTTQLPTPAFPPPAGPPPPPPPPPTATQSAFPTSEENDYGEPLPNPVSHIMEAPQNMYAEISQNLSQLKFTADAQTTSKPDSDFIDHIYGVAGPPQESRIGKTSLDENLDAYPKAVAIFAYTAERPDELSFNEDDVITIINKNEDGWFEGIINQRRGLFPGNYCEEMQETMA